MVLSDTRCKEVFLAGDLGQTGGGFFRPLMIAFSFLITVTSIGVFASVMIWLSARSDEASGKPDPVVEVQRVGETAESGTESKNDDTGQDQDEENSRQDDGR